MVPIKPSESVRRVTWGIRSAVVDVVGEGGEGVVGDGEEETEAEEAMVASFGLK